MSTKRGPERGPRTIYAFATVKVPFNYEEPAPKPGQSAEDWEADCAEAERKAAAAAEKVAGFGNVLLEAVRDIEEGKKSEWDMRERARAVLTQVGARPR
jgi:hypothetical protein